jgi:hypothetical protein
MGVTAVRAKARSHTISSARLDIEMQQAFVMKARACRTLNALFAANSQLPSFLHKRITS